MAATFMGSQKGSLFVKVLKIFEASNYCRDLKPLEVKETFYSLSK